MTILNDPRCRAGVVLWAILCVASGIRTVGAQGRTARGVVLRGDSHEPLSYSIVAVVGTSIERFTDDSGRFALTGLPSGDVTVRVRHIGYTPVDVPFVGDTLRVELQRIAVSLAGVRVDADRRCVDPPKRDPRATDPASVVINQLVENGRQYELVTTKYPFVARMRQSYGYLGPNGGGEHTSDHVDEIRSDRVWRYRPGEVIVNTPLGHGVNVPTIAVFAQEEFLRTHCFWLANNGDDSSGALRIEYHPADRLSDPDLEGTIYLDPKTFTIRRSLLRISKLARYTTQYDSVAVDTYFTELYPGVPIVTAIDGFDHFAHPTESREGKTRLAFLERQRVISIDFSHGPPGDTATRKRASVQQLLDRIVGVFDGLTGKPIPNATVLDTLSGREMKTSVTGTTRLAPVLNDIAVLKISAPGFEPLIVDTELSLKTLPPLTIVLTPVP
jgi:hypothetical protein